MGRKKIVLMHSLGRGGGYGGPTPKLLLNANRILRKKKADVVYVGDYHLFGITDELVMIPSFQYSSDAKFWIRGIVIVTEDGVPIPILTLNETDYEDNEEEIEKLMEWLVNLQYKVKRRAEETIRLCREFNSYRQTRYISRDLYNKIKELIEAGLPLNRIARMLGIDRTTIRIVKYGHPC